MTGFKASPRQRDKVRELSCAYCQRTPVDPAHLTARSQGGCDHPDCVIPLCRECHERFDKRNGPTIDLEAVLARRELARERAHMAFHNGFDQCIWRLRGFRGRV